MPHFLEKATLTNIRGIGDLEVKFEYPVSVLAGSNGSGKSTVLLTAACAYAPPGAGENGGMEGYTPAEFFSDWPSKFRFFPGYHFKLDGQENKGEKNSFTVRYQYSELGGQRSVCWEFDRRSKGQVIARTAVNRPELSVCLITSGNLTNPSDGKSVHDMLQKALATQETPIQEASFTPSQIEFAQQSLSFGHSRVVDLSHPNLKFNNKNSLLLVEREDGVVYSELHMAAGERAILRLLKEIPQAKGGLVLIDEVEAGLHPLAQKTLMQELQKLALANDFQIIVTTHSPVVLDSVPKDGRIFLDRNVEGKVSVYPPYHDLIQDALYGRSDKTFNLLCEDKAAKGILDGVFDAIVHSHPRAKRGSFNIQYTKDGASQFPVYAQVLKKFGPNVILILDGDQRGSDEEQKTQNNTQDPARRMFLPGKGAPEEWVWNRIRAHPDDFAAGLGIDLADLVQQIKDRDAADASAAGPPDKIAKTNLHKLSQIVKRTVPHTVPEICRIVSRRETELIGSCREMELEEDKIQPLVKYLETAFQEWRSGTSETD